MKMFSEVYDNLGDAIGWHGIDGFRKLKTVKTKEDDIAVQGFVKTIYVVVSDGTEYTVHTDRAGKKFTGCHLSTPRP
jgi:hypothetical protein